MRSGPFTLSTDGSNDQDGVKIFPMVVRTVHPETNSVTSELLSLPVLRESATVASTCDAPRPVASSSATNSSSVPSQGKKRLRTVDERNARDAASHPVRPGCPEAFESVCPAPDQRRRHEPKNKIDRDLITTHIKKYNPAVHHYRRKHAPNRLYLPSDITITDMHADFCTSVQRISLETYRTQVDKMNISFAVLGAKESETCKKHSVHASELENGVECACELCESFVRHKERTALARAACKADAAREPEDFEIITSVDLQKVIMLPRLPGVKSCAFTKRIIAFNETFAGLGKSTNNTAVVWNESISDSVFLASDAIRNLRPATEPEAQENSQTAGNTGEEGAEGELAPPAVGKVGAADHYSDEGEGGHIEPIQTV
ncbi:CAI-1 autoinducer sensor kinase/phosphatase CqsS [Elysia marginata]|uniref:CAI-1 autoinducer sensor kinase/phosphatase CqsS n=1 Tax=Elysia marginata TaxID=1093978 RepID=A0AAV4GVS6_9GAST|nr:CAI-1 autoinducer sensor kinase/phosphatase CqsS [Elysia marginata]